MAAFDSTNTASIAVHITIIPVAGGVNEKVEDKKKQPGFPPADFRYL